MRKVTTLSMGPFCQCPKGNVIRKIIERKVIQVKYFGFHWWLILLVAVTVACSPAATATPVPTPTPTPIPLPDPQVLLGGAVQQLQTEQYLSFVFDHPVGNTPLAPGVALTRAEGLAHLPNRFKVELDMESQGTALRLGIIVLESGAFVTNPVSGEWMPATSPEQVPFQLDLITGLVGAMLGGITGLEPVVEDEFNGDPVYLIRGVTPTAALGQVIPGALPDGQLPVEVLVDPASGKLLQAQMTGALVPGEGADTVRVLRLESLAQPPDISAP